MFPNAYFRIVKNQNYAYFRKVSANKYAKFASQKSKKSLQKSEIYFRKSAGLSLSSVVCCCADRKGGTTYEKYDKRTMARQHNTARGQQKQLERDEGATRIHGKASRGLGKDLHRRAEGDL